MPCTKSQKQTHERNIKKHAQNNQMLFPCQNSSQFALVSTSCSLQPVNKSELATINTTLKLFKNHMQGVVVSAGRTELKPINIQIYTVYNLRVIISK